MEMDESMLSNRIRTNLKKQRKKIDEIIVFSMQTADVFARYSWGEIMLKQTFAQITEIKSNDYKVYLVDIVRSIK